MTKVRPTCSSNGGSIHLKYSPSSDIGVSNPVYLSLSIHVTPPKDVPRVILTLELLEGNFLFDNSSRFFKKDLGNMEDNEETKVGFKVVCDDPDPNNELVMSVSTKDRGASDDEVGMEVVKFSVKKTATTEGDVRLTFRAT